jgi:hypothetical protein
MQRHRFCRAVVAFAIICLAALPARSAGWTLSNGGVTVTDSDGAVWLQNADLPASLPLTVPLCSQHLSPDCINDNGSMDYTAAQNWVMALNAYGGTGYLGHQDWQLPATQTLTAGCTATGKHGESFAYGCTGSALGALYSSGLNLAAPASAAAGPVADKIGGIANLQPNIYWTGTSASTDGERTFNFATGWSGANQGVNPAGPGKGPIANFFYVLPMLPGDAGIPGTIYDPAAKVSWLADGNAAVDIGTFGLPPCSGLGSATSAPCVNANGTMTLTSALAFRDAMNKYVNPDGTIGYLGRQDWMLPPAPDAACTYAGCAANDPLASLYYNLLGISGSDPVTNPVTAPIDDTIGAFSDVQPGLYWSCPASNDAGAALVSGCSTVPQCTRLSTPPCAADMWFSFNFGDGFQGTDEAPNDLFVTAYYVDVPEPPACALVLAAVMATLIAARTRRNGAPPAPAAPSSSAPAPPRTPLGA